tara:strand:+ start:602 stop:2272 length:1671 start_codon:yes stop_codon:yes gene_type:complete
MPILELSKKDMEKLLARQLPNSVDKLNEIFQYAGGEVESLRGDDISVEIKCRNRPDLWSAEGLARELRGALGSHKGLAMYRIKKTNKYKIRVSDSLEGIRPYIACAVVKGVKLTDQIIRQIMQQQEKVDGNYGRNRRKTSIGLYDADLIKFPLTYTTSVPTETSFIPLQMTEEMNLKQILSRHPTGRKYAHLVEGMKEYPIFKDARGKVLSFPPIINSDDLGHLTASSKNILIEVTGTDYRAVVNVLAIMTLSLADRGGKIHSTHIDSPFQADKDFPIFKHQTWKLGVAEVNAKLGLNLSGNDILNLLRKARYAGRLTNISGFEFLELKAPFYRTDLMHDVDLIEDVAIMYGYSKFALQPVKVPTTGALSPLTEFSDKIRMLMLGVGAQEVQTFTLTDPAIFEKAKEDKKRIKVENPISQTYSVLRNKIWPTLIDFLSKNTNREYPQKIFEVGEVVVPNSKAETASDTWKHLGFALAGDADFTYAKQVLCSLLASVGKTCSVKESERESFIPGRVGDIVVGGKKVGLVGELHPQVLKNFGIEMPVCVFELDLDYIL